AGEQEVADVATGLEADDVVAENPLDDGIAHPARKDLPVLRRGPGDMDELLQAGVGDGLTHHRGNAVQLVVLDQHQRGPRGSLSLDCNPLREEPVDVLVAVAPGAFGAGVENRLATEV